MGKKKGKVTEKKIRFFVRNLNGSDIESIWGTCTVKGILKSVGENLVQVDVVDDDDDVLVYALTYEDFYVTLRDYNNSLLSKLEQDYRKSIKK